jgi:hypothetical protein
MLDAPLSAHVCTVWEEEQDGVDCGSSMLIKLQLEAETKPSSTPNRQG